MPSIPKIIEKQQAYFTSGKTKNIDFRLKQLRILAGWIKNHEEDILDALKADLGKSHFEGYATEVGIVLDEIKYIRRHLRSWAKDKSVPATIKQFPAKCFLRSEPYGRVLIISPWNYPFQLTITPLAGAISAGNTAIIKPSEYSSATSCLISRMIRECFNEEYVTVFEGGAELNRELLSHKFDYIFFTGSTHVGKIVMSAAAKFLTSVTLELGGKSPCIVDETANIKLAARRIAWGKFLNAGQTCVAPDYLLIHHSVKDKFIDAFKKCINTFYGTKPLESLDYPKIINRSHFERILGLVKDKKIIIGGNYDPDSLKIEPTVLEVINLEKIDINKTDFCEIDFDKADFNKIDLNRTDLNINDFNNSIINEEIFGPVLPIITFEDINQAKTWITSRPKPLACYIFTRNPKVEEFLLNELSFGGGCINDTVIHLATSYMPFGGVGESGMGSYHGKGSFDTFSHCKSILKKSSFIDLPFRYPPFKKSSFWLLKRI